MINEQMIVMDFPIQSTGKIDKNDVVKALLERQQEVESTFKNDEFLKLDLTHEEILGVKSSSVVANIQITDLPALNFLISKNEKYKDCDIINLGNVNMLYDYFSQ